MKKTLTAIALGVFILAIATISCKKSTDQTPTPTPTPSNHYTTSLSGFGSHGGLPSGTPFMLPASIKLIGSMHGGFPGAGSIFFGPKTKANVPASLKTVYTEYGIGTYVNVYMKLFNTNYSTYKLIIPGGVVMLDSIPNDTIITDTTQGGIIIDPDTIVIDPRDTINVCLKSFCTNAHHPAPSSMNIYKFAVITNNESFHKVLTILRTKTTLAAHTWEIQTIIWNITDYGGLTQADIDLMNSWQ